MRRSGLLVGAAAIAAAGAALGGAREPREPPKSIVRRVDAPLLRISCDELPLKTPNPTEVRDDERERPYHALIRLWSFPGREPVDFPLDHVNVVGAGASARVGVGEYLFEDIGIGYTAVTIGEQNRGPAARGPGGRNTVGGRNPLVLARHAITVCDLFVPDEESLAKTTTFRGIVVDRLDASPIAGATVQCGEARAETGTDGRFELPGPVAWRDVVSNTTVSKDGWRSFAMNPRLLTSTWVDRLLRDGEAAFTLGRDPEPKPVTPLPPLER